METLGQLQWGAFATHFWVDSLQPPVQLAVTVQSLQKYRWVLPLYNLITLEYTLCWYSLEPYTPVVLMCQAIKSTQSINLIVLLHLAGGRAPLVLFIVFFTHLS